MYHHWRARFYPRDLPKARWLGYFAERFPTVEINNSFYRLPSEETFARWAAEVADGFVFSVKASRFITHIRRLRDPADPLKLFRERARRLGATLGPVLFQLPPRFDADLGRLDAFLKALPRGTKAAFEFRDPSWERDDVYDLLDRAGAALVLADRPRARPPDVVCGGWSYVRFHQGGERTPFYRREKLRRWADRIAAMRTREVWVYFNNDTDGAAVRDAVTLTRLLEERTRGVRGPKAA